MFHALYAIASSGCFRAFASRSGRGAVLLWLTVSTSWCQPVAAQTPGQPTQAPKEAVAAAKTPSSRAVGFEVAYPSVLGTKPISARVYVLLGRGNSHLEPRFGPDWFRPQPFFARDVKGWQPMQTVRIDSAATGFPGPLDSLEPGDYAIQAVVRVNPDTHSIGTGEGNAYGPVVHSSIDPKAASTIRLEVDKLVPPRKFQETERLKLAELESPLLSAFYHRPIKHRAAVILPEEKHAGKLPTVYIIPGFGGDHHMAWVFVASSQMQYARDLIRVILDPDCGTGHHVFADSATNGPRGRALTEEFIPYLEKTFSMVADPRARLLNGHSSGGWSSLWLQVTYPGFFGGTWSTSPDPVDFRDFQRVDIYAPGENIFRDRQGKTRPVARMGVLPVIFYDRFSKLEEALGPGGQLGSFEAVFSPVGRDGQPRKLWNRTTGAIDPEVAKAWEAYDIRLILERNWATLGPKLKGKIHVITGGMDSFYLEGATQLLKDSLARLKSDAVVEIIPGRDHSTVLDPNLARRLDREMKAAVAAFVDPK
jgi:S-formylglutathione hydrolase FrmB